MTEASAFPGATHLECTATGTTYESEQLIGLSEVGKPLFARYDIDAVRDRMSMDAVAHRRADLWRYAEMLPVRDPAARVALGEGSLVPGVGDGSRLDDRADPQTWLRYYASQEEREAWSAESSDPLPPAIAPPYPRKMPRRQQ